MVEDGEIENIYRVQIMNAAEFPQRYSISASGLPGVKIDGQTVIDVKPAEARWVTLAVRIPPESAQQAGSGAHELQLTIERAASDDGEHPAVPLTEKTTFIVPR